MKNSLLVKGIDNIFRIFMISILIFFCPFKSLSQKQVEAQVTKLVMLKCEDYNRKNILPERYEVIIRPIIDHTKYNYTPLQIKSHSHEIEMKLLDSFIFKRLSEPYEAIVRLSDSVSIINNFTENKVEICIPGSIEKKIEEELFFTSFFDSGNLIKLLVYHKSSNHMFKVTTINLQNKFDSLISELKIEGYDITPIEFVIQENLQTLRLKMCDIESLIRSSPWKNKNVSTSEERLILKIIYNENLSYQKEIQVNGNERKRDQILEILRSIKKNSIE